MNEVLARCKSLKWILGKIGVGALVAIAAFAVPQVVSAAQFKNNKLKGTYRCAINSDDNFENSIVAISSNGKGDVSAVKVLVSADYTCVGDLACSCLYTDSSGSYSINPDGTGSLTVTWTPGANDSACPTTGLTENWTIALSKKGKEFFVASDNNNLYDGYPYAWHPGTGGCTKKP